MMTSEGAGKGTMMAMPGWKRVQWYTVENHVHPFGTTTDKEMQEDIWDTNFRERPERVECD